MQLYDEHVAPINKNGELDHFEDQLSASIDRVCQVWTTAAYDQPESSVYLPADESQLAAVEGMVAAKVTPQLRYVFVVGIGGSNLGTMALYQALYPQGREVDQPEPVFLESIDEAQLQWLETTVVPTLDTPEAYLLVSVSKSGTTTETIANTEFLADLLDRSVGGVTERTVIISDADSAYQTAADKRGIAHLSIPKPVGGRYSVFSAVGLFPLAVLGVDLTSLRAGAQTAVADCVAETLDSNPAARSAAILAAAHVADYHIHDLFAFQPELESLGKWYRQLMGESIGKAENTAGEIVHTGLTPTVSIGSTDLHSVGQLYLGGPRDKVTTFLASEDTSIARIMPAERLFPNQVTMINEVTTSDINNAIRTGTKQAYADAALPFMEITLSRIDAHELGYFMQYKMIEMMYLGNLLGVNPFNQPNVESYKAKTRAILESTS